MQKTTTFRTSGRGFWNAANRPASSAPGSFAISSPGGSRAAARCAQRMAAQSASPSTAVPLRGAGREREARRGGVSIRTPGHASGSWTPKGALCRTAHSTTPCAAFGRAPPRHGCAPRTPLDALLAGQLQLQRLQHLAGRRGVDERLQRLVGCDDDLAAGAARGAGAGVGAGRWRLGFCPAPARLQAMAPLLWRARRPLGCPSSSRPLPPAPPTRHALPSARPLRTSRDTSAQPSSSGGTTTSTTGPKWPGRWAASSRSSPNAASRTRSDACFMGASDASRTWG
jgi:hypothetical protein